MPTQPYPFITDGIHGDVPNNFYPASDSDKQSILLPSPGLKSICSLTDCTEVRGLHDWGDYLYPVARRGSQSILWRVDPAGGAAELGTITTSNSGPVWMVNNQTQLCIVDGIWGYVYTPSTGQFVRISDLNFPGASSLDYQDGYGLFTKPDSNQWFFSSLYDFTTLDALDFYTKESSPGNIISLKSYKREPWIFGKDNDTEIWYNAGGDNSSAINPTFARNTGGVSTYGLGAANAVTAAHFLSWLTNEGQLVQAAGYNVQVISNQMFDRATRKMSSFADARAFDYMDQGHEFTQINFPTGDQTWVYDYTTKVLHKKQSYLDDLTGNGRHRANCYALLNNKHYVGDYSNGKIYEMSANYYDDDGEEIQRVLYSKEIDGGMEPISFPNVQIVVEPGVGLESGLDPKIMLQFSEDYGNTWTSEVWMSAGLVGDYTRRAMWFQMGQGFRRMYRMTVSDKVLWRVLGMSFGTM